MIRMNQNSATCDSTSTKGTSLQYRMHSCCMHLLKKSKCLVNGWSQDATHTCYKDKGLMPRERVNWLNDCIRWYVKVYFLIDFLPFCWTESIPLCISILKTIKKLTKSRILGTLKSPPNIFPNLPPNSRQTQPKWNLLGRIDTKVVICCY